MLEEKNEKTIFNRIYTVGARRIEIKTTTQVEKALLPIWHGISYLVRGKKFGTVEVLRTDEVVLLHIYFGRHVFRFRREDIPPEVDVCSLAGG